MKSCMSLFGSISRLLQPPQVANGVISRLFSWTRLPGGALNFPAPQVPGIQHQATASMATLNQMHRRMHRKKNLEAMGKKPASKMDRKPFMKAVVIRNLILKPAKPNSANRKCVKVRTSTGRELIAYIPGIGHSLQEHHSVLIKGGGKRDLRGIHYRVVRGKYDCPLPANVLERIKKKQKS